MDRRRFLAALAAGTTTVAGCSSSASEQTPTITPADVPGTAETETPPETPEDGEDDPPFGRSLATVVDFETIERTYALAPASYRSSDAATVELEFVETATADHPARVRGRLRNAASWSNTFRLDQTPPFGSHGFTGGVQGPDRELTYRSNLVFAPTEANEVAERVPEVERAADGTWRLAGDIGGQWNPETLRLDADESVRGEWYLVGRAEGVEEGRLTGQYEFRTGDIDLTATVWKTNHPGPDGNSRFAGRDVPPLPNSENVGWYHEADPGTPAYLDPSAERAVLPSALTVTLRNYTHDALTGNSWTLYKLDDGDWYTIGPWMHTAVLRAIPPGGRQEYELHAFGGEPVPCDGGLSVGYLGGGVYAFESMYGRESGHGSFAALVELSGPPVAVTPSENATAERDGSTVRVEWPHRQELPRATLTVERTDSTGGEDVERLLGEQVMRRRERGLRNTLGFLGDGVDKVVLRTDRNTVSDAANASGYERATRQFLFDGDRFEATARFDGKE